MARDKAEHAMHGLFVAKANYDLAQLARDKSRQMLNKAMAKAAAAGISKAEIARVVGTSAQRVGAVISSVED